jgi:pilus assembly protein Flp/PilA
MLKSIRSFFSDESGATAIEYGLIAALVSVAAILALTALGTELDAIFSTVSSTLVKAQPGS